jgi:dTMP kinase
VGFIVAIEGADGAGKRTASEGLAAALQAEGRSTRLLGFPRYSDTVGGGVLGDFLAGRIALPVTAEAAAVLYALDRLESRGVIEAGREAADVLILDRYIASNMAYQGAKVPAPERERMMRWIEELELGSFALPAPDICIFLDTPIAAARELIGRKETRSYTEDTYDAHEADRGLQDRVRDNYRALAAAGAMCEWLTVESVADGALRAPADIIAEIAAFVRARLP